MMQPENWKKIKEILDEALALDVSERQKFLRDAKISGEIRAEVESLLAFEEEAENLMHLSAVEFSKDFFEDDENSLIGRTFGAYRIIRELGEGGMGAVYLAERADGKFEQKVALKLLKREMNTAALRRRFEQEREILASLEHPNIARLLDAGSTDDKIPFLAMEYIEGLPIDEYCRRSGSDLGQRLDLFRKVCAAVGFAHRNLIVHRDLKPSNILVTADGTPKLLDFGISKILSAEISQANSATVTRLGVMTPGYASPEQLQSRSVTTATDIYSLGVILYELLSGHRPFEAQEANLKSIYHAVLEEDPPPPSALIDTATKDFKELTNAETQPIGDKNSEVLTEKAKIRYTRSPTIGLNSSALRGDLDNIVLKALRKEPERRYSSAENLAEDIHRHQRGLPVEARPNTFSYRAEKFIKRNRAGVLATILIFLAVAAGIGATLWQARVARNERARAVKRFNDVRALANSFLFEFSPQIENLPGSTPARELLVRRALEYLDNLSQEAGDDAELQRELAAAYEKVGDVQGNTFKANLGDSKGALESYAKAQAIREKLLAQDPGNLKAQSDLADTLKLIGDIQSNGGDYARASEFYDQSLAWREKIAARNPQDFEAREKLALMTRTRGLIPFYEGDNKKAIEYFQRARALYEGLHAEQPEHVRIAEDYSYCYTLIGEAQGWDNDFQGAAANLQIGLEMMLPLGEKFPFHRSVQRTLMLALQKRAENHLDLEEFDRSIALYAQSAAIAENSLKADPQNFLARRDAAMSYKKWAQALDAAGKGSESLEKLEKTLKMFEELSAADPANTEYAYDIANTRFSVGEAQLNIKDLDAALATFTRAAEEFQAVLVKNPESPYAFRMSSFNQHRLGKTYIALAEKDKNAGYWQKASEHISIALDNLNKMRSDGKLGEVDLPAIAEMEGELQKIKPNIRQNR